MRYTQWRDEFEHFLGVLDEEERGEILSYYAEMYADKRDEGLSEEEVVAQFGAPYDAARKILDGEEVKYKKSEQSTDAEQQPEDEQAHFLSDGAVDALELNGALGNASINFYDGDKVQVDYPASALFKYKVTQQGGKVKIEHKSIKWKSSVIKRKIMPDTVVLIPRELVPDLDITLAAGNVTVGDGEYGNINIYVEGGALKAGRLTCQDMKVITDAGKTEIESAISHRLHAEVNAGKLACGSVCGSTAQFRINAGSADIGETDCKRTEVYVSIGKAKLTLCGAREDYDAEIKNNFGSCNLEGRSLNCERSIKAEVSLGSLNVEFTR